jgi:hypothetical protein
MEFFAVRWSISKETAAWEDGNPVEVLSGVPFITPLYLIGALTRKTGDDDDDGDNYDGDDDDDDVMMSVCICVCVCVCVYVYP